MPEPDGPAAALPVRDEILRQLHRTEVQHEVRVLLAIESGSRAWGFASPNSDWDVRFIYVPRLPWYLRVDAPRDVIELPISGDLDINGWELRKALALMQKCNPTLLEWLDSPLIYLQDEAAMAQFRALGREFFMPLACWHHYRSMARTNYREYLQSANVKLKKYLYVLRPLLACKWIEQGRGPAPMLFQTLFDELVQDAGLRAAIDSLLDKKRGADELAEAPRIPALNDFIEAELQRGETIASTIPVQRPDAQAYARADDFLRDTVLDG
jgi:uncharacterized protein